MDTTLTKPLRSALESAVKAARNGAETAAAELLNYLGVGLAEPPAHLNEEQRRLRRRLRAHGRQLGDVKADNDTQELNRLVRELAYEHWHRMLFARFLAENGLLMHPDGVPLSLAECEQLAPHEEAANGWELAGRYAARMLPQIFRPDSPALAVSLMPERQRALERLVAGLDRATLTASDSLGWCYQFWQAQRKDEVNRSEVKIGADELSAVTQLFTEPYMVAFLLHNSLGAWWVARHPELPCPVELTYLRRLEDGTPAAGQFASWPESLAELRLLDPCCGSGHFLVAAFLLLVPMRMQLEGLSAADAVAAVLRDNLHGLELDARCVEIAAFALALAAWRFPGAGGYRTLPALNLACVGQAIRADKADWLALAGANDKQRRGMGRLYDLFQQAPLLGSLITPERSAAGDLIEAGMEELAPLLAVALKREGDSEQADDVAEAAVAARGLLTALRLLQRRYTLVITNVPYLTRGKQSDPLKDFCQKYYPAAKNDLANVFLERCLELCQPGGATQIVMPQNWLFLTSYKKQREHLLKNETWNLLARLGMAAFEIMDWWAFNVILITFTHARSSKDFKICGVDASISHNTQEKSLILEKNKIITINQMEQLKNPDSRVVFSDINSQLLLSKTCKYGKGSTTGDSRRFLLEFWQIAELKPENILWLDSPKKETPWSGRSLVTSTRIDDEQLITQLGCRIHGQNVWDRKGAAVNKMKDLEPFLYNGEIFDDNVCPIVPHDTLLLPAIWSFIKSEEYRRFVREIDHALKVTAATLTKVPFDLAHWQAIAAEHYPNGLPKPYSDDPTQWLFHGHPAQSDAPLHVALARLLGYRWPAESDPDMELADEARDWIARVYTINSHALSNGILCIPPVCGEPPAADRLRALLETAYGPTWTAHTLNDLLAAADWKGKSLDTWLSEKCFEQHCKLFHHRPFIWHIWDGLQDGFSALLNYHTLDRRTLETLIYTYLGDWLRQQTAAVAAGVDGADSRLAAARDLERRLILILEGEKPYDIFIRWKPLAEQPIGWEPDLNDGVRLNIRPFVQAEILRHHKPPKLNIKWDKDRGKDVNSAPWYTEFQGDRINSHHLTLAEKTTARKARDKQTIS